MVSRKKMRPVGDSVSASIGRTDVDTVEGTASAPASTHYHLL